MSFGQMTEIIKLIVIYTTTTSSLKDIPLSAEGGQLNINSHLLSLKGKQVSLHHHGLSVG